MLYQRSLDIERRLQTVLQLIKSGRYSTPDLAEEVGVSIPTISRDVTALRQRGHDILAERHDGAWHYVLAAKEQDNARRRRVASLKRKPR
jgi:DeoR/GlpR family transcriptional regulator of sugar metabolism